jgi:hypothetical protein
MATDENTIIPSGTFYRNNRTQEVLRIENNHSDNKTYLCTLGREVSYTATINTDTILKNWLVLTNDEILFNGSKIKIGPDGRKIPNCEIDDLVILSRKEIEDYKPGLCSPFVIFLSDGSDYEPHVCFGFSIEDGVKYIHLKPLDRSQPSIKMAVACNPSSMGILPVFAKSKKADHYYGVRHYWDPSRNVVGHSVGDSPIFYAFVMCGKIFTDEEPEDYVSPSVWVGGTPPDWKPTPNKVFYRNEKERLNRKRLQDTLIPTTNPSSVTSVVPAPADEFGTFLQPITDISIVYDGKPCILYLKKDREYSVGTYYEPFIVLGYMKENNLVMLLKTSQLTNLYAAPILVNWDEISSNGVAINPKNHFQIASAPGQEFAYVKDKKRNIMGVMDSFRNIHYCVSVDGKELIHIQNTFPGDNWKIVDPRTTNDTRKSGGVHLCENLGEYQILKNSIRRIEKDYGYKSNFRLELMEGANPVVKPIASEESTTSVDQPGIENKNNQPPYTPSVVRKSTMSKMTDTLKNDGKEAAVRVAARQGTKLVVEPLAALLCRHMGDDSPEFRAKVGRFLQTDLGRAIAMGAFSAGLSALPLEGNHKDAIARELRVEAMAMLGDELAEVLIGPLREVTALYLKGFPQEEAPLEALPSGEVLSHASEGQEIGVVEKSLPVVRLVSRLNPSTLRLRGFS